MPITPPRIHRTSNVIAGGVSCSGMFSAVKTADFKYNMQKERIGSMDAPYAYENGMEEMEGSVKLVEPNPLFLQNLGQSEEGAGGNVGGGRAGVVNLQVLGVWAYMDERLGIVIDQRVKLTSLMLPELKSGESNETEFPFTAEYLDIAVNGGSRAIITAADQSQIHVDLHAGVRRINGIDELEGQTKFLQLATVPQGDGVG